MALCEKVIGPLGKSRSNNLFGKLSSVSLATPRLDQEIISTEPVWQIPKDPKKKDITLQSREIQEQMTNKVTDIYQSGKRLKSKPQWERKTSSLPPNGFKKKKVLEWPSQSLNLNPIEMLWYDLKKAVWAQKLSNMAQLKQFCSEKWVKIPPQWYERLIANYWKCLITVLAAKVGTTSY